MSSFADDPIGDQIVRTPSLPNPNAHRNRAPAKSELLGLRSFVDTNSRIIGMLDGEIEKLRGSYDVLQARYIRQQLELEATLSELHKAKDLLVAVQKQRVALQAEQDDLHALMHPIRRCPDDILVEIFNLTIVGVIGRRAKMNQAIRCSSVCQRWRVIALEAPRLWTHLSLRLYRSLENQEFLRTHIIPRIKQATTDVVLWPVNSENLPALGLCGVQDIPVIGELRILLDTQSDGEYLLSHHFIPPTGFIRTLSMGPTELETETETQENVEQVDIMRLLDKFPPFTTLRIRTLPNFSFPTGLTNTSIAELELYNMGQVNITTVLKCLPHLESLKIENSTLVADRVQDLFSVGSVKEIHLHQTKGKKWMERVAFPVLRALTYYGAPKDALLGFVSAHQSLVKLISNLDGNTIPTLATTVPKLLDLMICPPVEGICRTLDGSSGLPFPLLKSLTVSSLGLTLEAFDALVRARCLPMRHPSSQAKQPSDVISRFAIIIVAPTTPSSTPQLHDSDLYKGSSKETDEDHPEKVYLSWPEWE